MNVCVFVCVSMSVCLCMCGYLSIQLSPFWTLHRTILPPATAGRLDGHLPCLFVLVVAMDLWAKSFNVRFKSHAGLVSVWVVCVLVG